MKRRLLSIFILTMFSTSLFAVSLMGDTYEPNNEYNKTEVVQNLNTGTINQSDINTAETPIKSKNDINVSATPIIILNDNLHEKIIENISKNKSIETVSTNELNEDTEKHTEEDVEDTVAKEETVEEVIEEADPIETIEHTEQVESTTTETIEEEIVTESTEIAEQEPEENICKNRWGITLTDDEIYLLGCIVMLESGGEGDLGQQAVTEVIFNRMVDDYFGGSLYDVLSRKGQFVTWKNRNSERAHPSERVMANIHKVINGETYILPFETVYFSTSPQNSRIQTEIGCHVFCNE